MPHYKKAFDIGTYTGNGGQYRVGIPTLRGVGPTGTQIANSLRFRAASSTYLTRTPGSATNQTTWTWSGWVKRTEPGSRTGLFSAGSQGPGYPYYETYLQINENDNLLFLSEQNPTSSWIIEMYLISTTKIFKDSSKWYHIICAVDTTQATSTNRLKLYVDGQQITSFSTSTYPSQNQATYINTTKQHVIGTNWNSGIYPSGEMADGYIAEVNFIDGQALTPSSFGEYNSDGIWVPKAYSGTYGTNGFYLKFASGAVGTDSSGNGNTWTLNSFNTTTANTTYDIVTDSPTDYGTDTGAGAEVKGNYCIWNPSDKSSAATLSAGSLLYGATSAGAVGSGNNFGIRSTIGVSSGKWYAEFTKAHSDTDSQTPGVGTQDIVLGSYNSYLASTSGVNALPNSSSIHVGIDGSGNLGVKIGSSLTYTTPGTTWTTGDVLGYALDCDNSTLKVYKNGVQIGGTLSWSGTTPYGNVLYFFSSQTTTWHTPGWYANFGQKAFSYTAPSGFKALCSTNITRPADSSLWFYGDTPDLMWIKNRSTTGLHTITDTIRGAGLNLVTSSTAAETSYPAVSEMNKFGMSVINDATAIVNGSGNSHVYWAWKAGGQSVTNTDGTITSQVSVNRQAGFSIVSWTGTGASSASVGHGLGTGTPNFVIIKKRNVSEGWYVCHSSSGQGLNYAYHLFLNTTGALVGSNDPYILGTQTNDNKLYLADGVSNNGGNQSGTNYIAYCWNQIPGYSSFGSYIGSGGADGPYVYLGFRPRWIMWKRTDTVSSWFIYDAVRNTYNIMGLELYANSSDADTATTRMDFLSNGFKLRAANAGDNASSGTYIYAAFAESPFKYARAR